VESPELHHPLIDRARQDWSLSQQGQVQDKAVYPAETIEAHRAFIARRRTSRPSEEYRTPTEEEWDAFLAHFEKRKVSIGTCARAFGTPCIHEHACVRCSLLRADPAQRARLADIRDNLIARIAEAEREGWLGEVEGLQVSLAGAEEELTQLDSRIARRSTTVTWGCLPSLTWPSAPPHRRTRNSITIQAQVQRTNRSSNGR
jgi:hypothetical protein